MQTFALVRDGIVVEIISVANKLTIGVDIFTPEFAADLVPATGSVSVGMAWDGEAFGPAPVAPPPDKAALKAYAAAKRWDVENGGTTVAGIPVATDDRSKMMVTGARVAADANPSWSTTWIGSDGNPYPVNAAAMVAISDAVLAHINQSFEVFGALLTGIDAGTITSFAAIDAANWPA